MSKIYPFRQAMQKARATKTASIIRTSIINNTELHIKQVIIGLESLMRDRRAPHDVMDKAADARIHLFKAENLLKQAKHRCEDMRK